MSSTEAVDESAIRIVPLSYFPREIVGRAYCIMQEENFMFKLSRCTDEEKTAYGMFLYDACCAHGPWSKAAIDADGEIAGVYLSLPIKVDIDATSLPDSVACHWALCKELEKEVLKRWKKGPEDSLLYSVFSGVMPKHQGNRLFSRISEAMVSEAAKYGKTHSWGFTANRTFLKRGMRGQTKTVGTTTPTSVAFLNYFAPGALTLLPRVGFYIPATIVEGALIPVVQAMGIVSRRIMAFPYQPSNLVYKDRRPYASAYMRVMVAVIPTNIKMLHTSPNTRAKL